MLVLLLQFAFSYQSTYDFQGREYQIYQTHVAKPMIVHFHGCNQNADDFYSLTKSVERSVEANIVFVEQRLFWHPLRCWNWFYDQNQTDTVTSESYTVMQKLLDIKHQLKASSIHLVGFSSGAGIAANLAFVYAKHIDSVLLHSGPAFAVANGANEANRLLEDGETNRDILRYIPNEQGTLNKVFLVQGTKDERVHPNNQNILIDQWKYFFKINKPVHVRRNKQQLLQHGKAIIIWRFPIAHEWAGGNAESPHSAPQADDALEYYYSSVVGI